MGASGSAGIQRDITYPNPYSDANKLIINMTSDNNNNAKYGDAFHAMVTYKTTTMTVNIRRVNISSGWGYPNSQLLITIFELF